MKWSEVRELYPNEFVLLEILKEHIDGKFLGFVYFFSTKPKSFLTILVTKLNAYKELLKFDKIVIAIV